MVNLILILLHIIPIFGIIAIVRKYKRYEANSHRKVYQCNTDYHTPSLATIRSRATTAFDLVENGEVKREVLLTFTNASPLRLNNIQ